MAYIFYNVECKNSISVKYKLQICNMLYKSSFTSTVIKILWLAYQEHNTVQIKWTIS